MSCYYRGKHEPRALRGRHDDGCVEAAWHAPLVWVDCDGCTPCWLNHCANCGMTHVDDLVCHGCIGDVREDLHAIVKLSADLPAEAESRGVQSEAFHLAGPVANPAAWRQRGQYGHKYPSDARLGEDHPLWVLGTWDMLVTELLGHTRTGRIGIDSAADYLDRNLTDLAQNPDFGFQDLGRELSHCRSHLDLSLHDGEQIEKRAPCLTCKRPLVLDKVGERVRYRCTKCRRDLTENEYRLAVRAAHVAHADRLCIDDMADRLSIKASTLRRWANVVRVQRPGSKPIEHPPLIRSCGADTSGRKVYRVADVEAVRDAGGDRRRSGIVSTDGGDKCSLPAPQVS